MKKQLLFLLLICLVINSSRVSAQDPHFTQIVRMPNYYNPAAAGYGIEHIRLTMLYRNQWASVQSPFTTQSLFFDKHVDRIGFGANLVNNTSGDAGIRQFQLNGQLAYRVTLGQHHLNAGMQIGFIQKSFDPSKMTFDDQYTPDQGYDPSQATSESFAVTKVIRPDFGSGLLWTYGAKEDSKFHPYLGASLLHMMQPKETFIIEENYIPTKLILSGGVGIKVNDEISITPLFQYAKQQIAKETIYGMLVSLPIQEKNKIEGGIFYRQNTSINAYVGYQFNKILAGFSYDLNAGGITSKANAFEISLSYIPKAKDKPKKKIIEEEDEKDKLGKGTKLTSIPKPPLDTDGDGVSDKLDKCPDVKGSRLNSGCPPAPAKTVVAAAPSVVINKMVVQPKAETKAPVVTPTKNSQMGVNVFDQEQKAKSDRTEINKAISKQSPQIRTAEIALAPVLIKRSVSKFVMPKASEEDEVKPAVIERDLTLVDKLIPIRIEPNNSSLSKSSSIPKKRTVPAFIMPAYKEDTIDSNPIAKNTIENLNSSTMVEMAEPIKLGLLKNNFATTTNILSKRIIAEHELPKWVDDTIVQKPNTTAIIKAEKIQSINLVSLKGENIKVNSVPKKRNIKPWSLANVKDINFGVEENTEIAIVLSNPASTNATAIKPIEIKANGEQVYIGNVDFETRSSSVDGIYLLDVIEPASDSIFFNEKYSILLTGHTDKEGTTESSLVLSNKRAEKVRDILVRKGVPKEAIEIIGYGESMPLDEKNNTKSSNNKRVEVFIIRNK